MRLNFEKFESLGRGEKGEEGRFDAIIIIIIIMATLPFPVLLLNFRRYITGGVGSGQFLRGYRSGGSL